MARVAVTGSPDQPQSASPAGLRVVQPQSRGRDRGPPSWHARRTLKPAAIGRGTTVIEPTDETNLPKTKCGQVLALLQRPKGATLAELISATNWKPHTTRAALTGLRKKGHAIVKGKRGEVTCDNVPAAA